MKKLLFIYNAKSGKALIRKHLADIIDVFIKAGYRVETYQTQCAKDAQYQVEKRGKKFDLIVCSGGDGTLNEVVTGTMNAFSTTDERVTIGYIPSGSTNDFASSINLPKNMISSAKVAVYGKSKYVDIGSLNNKNFVYIAAFGAFTEVSYNTSQELKNILGHQAYILEGLKGFIPAVTKAYNAKFYFDGKKIEGEFIYAMVSNSNSVGGFKGLAGKDIGLDDGVFEVTLIRQPKSPLELNDIITSLLMGKKCRSVISFKTSDLTVVSEEKIDWVLDGEFGGSLKKAVIKNHHKAINVMSGDNFRYKKVTKEK